MRRISAHGEVDPRRCSAVAGGWWFGGGVVARLFGGRIVGIHYGAGSGASARPAEIALAASYGSTSGFVEAGDRQRRARSAVLRRKGSEHYGRRKRRGWTIRWRDQPQRGHVAARHRWPP